VDHTSQDRQLPGEPSLAADARMRGTTQLRGLRIPDPQFPTKIPHGRQSSYPVRPPAPGGQSDPSHRAGGSSVEQLRWARCPDDGRLHLLQPADVTLAATRGHAPSLCGYRIPVQGLTIKSVPSGSGSGSSGSGSLCMACVIGATSETSGPDRRGTS
jgi:hypothetical protein